MTENSDYSGSPLGRLNLNYLDSGLPTLPMSMVGEFDSLFDT